MILVAATIVALSETLWGPLLVSLCVIVSVPGWLPAGVPVGGAKVTLIVWLPEAETDPPAGETEYMLLSEVIENVSDAVPVF